MYKADCEMDADLFYKIVTEELLPDIREKMIDFDLVYVQIDGARPHVRRWDDLQEAGAERRQIGTTSLLAMLPSARCTRRSDAESDPVSAVSGLYLRRSCYPMILRQT